VSKFKSYTFKQNFTNIYFYCFGEKIKVQIIIQIFLLILRINFCNFIYKSNLFGPLLSCTKQKLEAITVYYHKIILIISQLCKLFKLVSRLFKKSGVIRVKKPPKKKNTLLRRKKKTSISQDVI
jgi:hypothetical protein